MLRPLLLSVLSVCSVGHLSAADTPPNIIVMLVDDMGWTDLGCQGSKYYETPHVDQLAKDGMRFTQAYSACTVCSPTRAAMMTGKAPARLHLTDWIAGHVPHNGQLLIPNWTMQLPLAEETLAERLKTRGYATASIGKWHLGGEEFAPTKHGFDVNIGGTHSGSPASYFSPYKIATLTDGPPDEFLTDRLTEEAVKFITKHQAKPFFVYLPHYAVHTPIMGKPEVVAKYQAKKAAGGHSNPVYAALVESVDDSVGKLRATLNELKLAENTLFIFTSDNGGLSQLVTPQGWSRGPTDNSPARLGKGSAHEGGVHIPLIVSWPGKVTPGSTCDVPVITYDHVPTLLEATQTPLKEGQVVDGESMMPLLTDTSTLKRAAIYWHYPHYHPGSARPYSAIREGDWKLLQFYEDNHVELYNLKLDAGEADNRAPYDSVRALQLRDKLNAWLQATGAQIPERNPKFDPDQPLNQPKQPGGKKKAE